MNNPSDIRFVNSHTKSNGGAYYLNTVINEVILSLVPMLRRQSGMVDTASDSLLLQHLCYSFRFITAHTINDSTFFSVAMDKLQNRFILLFCLKTAFYVQADVGTVDRRNKRPGLYPMQLSDYILTGYFVGCCR